jgi:hypothetical protein
VAVPLKEQNCGATQFYAAKVAVAPAASLTLLSQLLAFSSAAILALHISVSSSRVHFSMGISNEFFSEESS